MSSSLESKSIAGHELVILRQRHRADFQLSHLRNAD